MLSNPFFPQADKIKTYPLPTYHLFEMTRAAMAPMRMAAEMTTATFSPFKEVPFVKQMLAQAEMVERATRHYTKPNFNIPNTVEEIVWSRPFCNLIRFKNEGAPKVLMVAPMSGHYATLLRATVEAFAPTHDVYITDWIDARQVPLSDGHFDLDDYIDYVMAMIRHLGKGLNVMAVCQPSVPVLAAIARMEQTKEDIVPATLTLMGGPIDTRSNPTAVNKLAGDKGIDWFRTQVITRVPFPYKGAMREVYPGFLQITGFMTMNLDRHINAHKELYNNLMVGNEEEADRTTDFYDEYLAVMDLTAEYYIQTIDRVFIRHCLPLGTMMHRSDHVDPSAIKRVALMTVEGEKDDITGGGQTEAAQTLCTSIPKNRRMHYLQPDVGHYGVFSGSRFRAEISPRIKKFMKDMA